MDEQSHHHHQAPGEDVRQAHVFSNSGYGGHSNYPPPGPAASMPSHMSGGHGGPIPARRHDRTDENEPEGLFPNIPEAKKRKFILVEDNVRGSRLRVRVTLEGVDTREIPDSFRKGSSVFPRSYFPREMQSPPPSATGSRFFADDAADDEDDGVEETEGRGAKRPGARSNATKMVKAPIGEGTEAEIAIPRMKKSTRGKEVRMNDLGYRMAWLQSRVFSGRTVFLQRARESCPTCGPCWAGPVLTGFTVDCYRNKTQSAINSMMQDPRVLAPHYETRVGKARFNERAERMRGSESDN